MTQQSCACHLRTLTSRQDSALLVSTQHACPELTTSRFRGALTHMAVCPQMTSCPQKGQMSSSSSSSCRSSSRPPAGSSRGSSYGLCAYRRGYSDSRGTCRIVGRKNPLVSSNSGWPCEERRFGVRNTGKLGAEDIGLVEETSNQACS